MVVARGSVFDAKFRRNAMRNEDWGIKKHHHIEEMVQALGEKNSNDAPFAFVSIDCNGNVQFHASRQVKGFLDEQLFTSKFEEAHKVSLQQSYATSSTTSSPDQSSVARRTQSLHIVEDEVVHPQQDTPRKTSRGLLRTARQRERLTMLREMSPGTPPYPAPAEVHDSAIKSRGMKSFRIDSKKEVTAYLESRLKRLQQLAGKKIAKAWIKGICPKKQARFPYRNKKRCDDTIGAARVPGWWPLETVCKFLEPDHIRREERMELCLHLLRLRPTPEQLRAWNKDTTEHTKTHKPREWTAFLKELAGPELFDDLPKEALNRVQLRHTLLEQLYEVAALEERYENDEIDGGELYFCEQDEERETGSTLSKRSRRSSVTSSQGDSSRQSSVSASGSRAKRARQNTEHSLDQSSPGFDRCPEVIEDRLNQEQPQQLDIPLAPAPPQAGIEPSSSATQSPWVTIQPHPISAQPAMTSAGDSTFDPAVSMVSRKRALRAQRKMQADQFNNPFNTAPIKQETQSSIPQPQPQGQVLTWYSSNNNQWMNPMSPCCSPHTNPIAISTAYSIPQPSFPEPQRYTFPQYISDQLNHQPVFNQQMYSGQGMLDPGFCVPPECYANVQQGPTHSSMSMPSSEYMLSTGQENLPLEMQQPRSLDSWQHSGMPERQMQSGHGLTEFYYSEPATVWNDRG